MAQSSGLDTVERLALIERGEWWPQVKKATQSKQFLKRIQKYKLRYSGINNNNFEGQKDK